MVVTWYSGPFAGDLGTNYFKLNSALNGGSVWQNDCKKIVHVGSRFDNNTSQRGSAGIEMNQVSSADISSCTFTTGKGAKGSALYLQASLALHLNPSYPPPSFRLQANILWHKSLAAAQVFVAR
jgi:hypothetical protein